jgi:hypothetical protein
MQSSPSSSFLVSISLLLLETTSGRISHRLMKGSWSSPSPPPPPTHFGKSRHSGWPPPWAQASIPGRSGSDLRRSPFPRAGQQPRPFSPLPQWNVGALCTGNAGRGAAGRARALGRGAGRRAAGAGEGRGPAGRSGAGSERRRRGPREEKNMAPAADSAEGGAAHPRSGRH